MRKLAVIGLVVASLACQTIVAPLREGLGFESAPTEVVAVLDPTRPAADPAATPTVIPTEIPALLATPTQALQPFDAGQPDQAPLTIAQLNLVLQQPASADSLSHPDRPLLDGTYFVLDSPNFRIHFNTTGEHAIPSQDNDNNQIPDYAEEVALAVETSRYVQVEVMGWAAPPPDEGIGGDDRYDVYLENVFDEGLAGYAEGGYRETTVGDNPNSPQIERDASHSFLVIDNDFAEMDEQMGVGFPMSTLDLMRVTAAHEFNHSIQYGYDAQESAFWLWEATATWMEEWVYDSVNDGEYYLSGVFDSPDTCQIAEGGDEDADDYNHWYAMWIFIEYLSERHGPELVRTIWENTIDHEGYSAIDLALADRGTSVEQAFTGFAIALLARSFEEGQNYSTVVLEGQVSVGETFLPTDGVGQLAVDYVEVLGSGQASISIDGLQALGIGYRRQNAEVFVVNEGQMVVDLSAYDHFYLLVINQQRANSEESCRLTDYTIAVNDAAGQPLSAVQQTRTDSNFSPP
jgi:hypothetical protein